MSMTHSNVWHHSCHSCVHLDSFWSTKKWPAGSPWLCIVTIIATEILRVLRVTWHDMTWHLEHINSRRGVHRHCQSAASQTKREKYRIKINASWLIVTKEDWPYGMLSTFTESLGLWFHFFPVGQGVPYTSSTAQGGGGSFSVGELACCESRMTKWIHWWTERWLDSCLMERLQWLEWSPHLQLLDVAWCSALVVVVVV